MINQTMKNELSSDLLIRPEFMAGPSLLNPFVQYCSMQRSMMYGSHIVQRLNLTHPEQPRIMTGYEKIFGKYEFTPCRISQDCLLRKIIPKFDPIRYTEIAKNMPSWKLIYVGSDDRQVHSCEMSTYTMLHDGFGYYNKMLGFEKDLINEGNLLPKGEKLTTSPSHDGNRYMAGLNVNVAYLTEWGVTEDAFIVSEDLANRFENTAFHQCKLTIDYDNYPLNLYGKEGEYKCFPSIGDTVRADGALLALRRVNKSTAHTDSAPENLRDIQYLHDEVYRAPAGAKIIDVDVYISFDAERRLKDQDATKYKQFFDIRDLHKYQHDTILQTYKQLCIKEGLECSPEFHTQVVRAATISNNKEFVKKTGKLYDAREPVEFITVVITYAYKRKLTKGSKLTDRNGGKGVISSIWKTEDMPVDDNGVRADIIMTPASVINRMNPAQWMETFWNRVGLQVIRNVKDQYLGGWKQHDKPEAWLDNIDFRTHWKEIYKYILGFFHDFRPAYAEFVNNHLPSDQDKLKFTEECLNEGLYLINNFNTCITRKQIINAAKKYGVERTPVTYNVYDQKTGAKRTIRTRNPVLIGSKYMMLLGKLPSATISAVEISYVNQFSLPIKPQSKHVKSQAIIGLTPQKFGEDETCILNMSIRDDKIARFFALHSSAPSIVKMLGKELLTQVHPSAMVGLPIKTQDVINMNQNVSMNNHMFSVIGYSCVPNKTPVTAG